MRRSFLRATRLVLLLCAARCAAGGVTLSVGAAENLRVPVSITAEGRLVVKEVELFRSTTRFGEGEPDVVQHPVAVLWFPAGSVDSSLADTSVAHNATYFYRARLALEDGATVWTNVDSVSVPDVRLGQLVGSSIFVDKLNYFLEVRCGGLTKKRYPIALGRDPKKRKLHQDNATTPEGIYRITHEQPKATFYKAFDLSYPNDVDRARYEFSKSEGLLGRSDAPGIGGEIQIHGQGIERNWTFGCIALRNEDMDELFAHRRVGKGMPVIIVGTEITDADVSSIQDYRTGRELREMQQKLKDRGLYSAKPSGKLDRETRLALGKMQKAAGLPITCDLDSRAVRLLAVRP